MAAYLPPFKVFQSNISAVTPIQLLHTFVVTPIQDHPSHSGHIYSCPGRVIQNSDIAVCLPPPSFAAHSSSILTICHLPLLPLFLTMFILSITIYSPFFSSIHIPRKSNSAYFHIPKHKKNGILTIGTSIFQSRGDARYVLSSEPISEVQYI